MAAQQDYPDARACRSLFPAPVHACRRAPNVAIALIMADLPWIAVALGLVAATIAYVRLCANA